MSDRFYRLSIFILLVSAGLNGVERRNHIYPNNKRSGCCEVGCKVAKFSAFSAGVVVASNVLVNYVGVFPALGIGVIGGWLIKFDSSRNEDPRRERDRKLIKALQSRNAHLESSNELLREQLNECGGVDSESENIE